MTNTQSQIDEKMMRRAREVGSPGFNMVIDKIGCPNTGAGVVLTQSLLNDSLAPVAHFFKPRQLRHPFMTRKVQSAHERIALLDTLHDAIKAEKSEKTAPHDLEVGDIICETWGATMQGACFYVVTDVPTPRKVAIAEIETRTVTGNSMNGTIEPLDTESPAPKGESTVCLVRMHKGTAQIKADKLSGRAERWNQKPVHVYSD